MLLEIGEHISKHGDSVKDIAFEVEDLDAIFKVSLCIQCCAVIEIQVIEIGYVIEIHF